MKKIITFFFALIVSDFLNAQTPNSWIQKSDYGGNSSFLAVSFSIGVKGYVGTGMGSNLNDLWEYNPGLNSWTQKTSLPSGPVRHDAVGFSIGNKGYIGTGTNSTGNLKDLWEYDPDANTWTQKSDFGGDARGGAVGFSIGNKGYIGTGFTSGGSSKDFWEYNPVNNLWTQKSDFGGQETNNATGCGIGNKGYVGLGDNGCLWEYDPSLNTWSQKANYPSGAVTKAVSFAIGAKGYFGTGDDLWGIFHKDFWEYNPGNNTWTQRTDFGGTGRTWAIGLSIGSRGYIGTGHDTSPGFAVKDFWEYIPICTAPVSTIYSSGNTTLCGVDSVFLYACNGYNYQWKKNGVDITGATSYFYYAKTTGGYTCYLTNSCGAVTSSAISVTVNSLPSATITPAGATTFCSGGSVVLNVPAGSNKTYQWKKGANLIPGAAQSSYTATSGGNYRVIVTNTVTGCSKTTGSAAVVTVNALPTATITPQGPTTFCAGGSVVLQANTGAGLTYKWKKGSNFISGAALSNYTATAGGNYRVQVTNSNGCSKTSALVAVSVPCREGENVKTGERERVVDMNVYPNPNSGEFTIKFSIKPTSPVQIELTDEIGKVVKKIETGDEIIVIKESNLAKGIYCLTVINNENVMIKKINITQ